MGQTELRKLPRREPFFGWPEWSQLRYFAFLALVQTLWFELIYCGTDFLTARRRLRLKIHLELEELLPIIPAMVWVYMSLYLLFLGAPFILRTREYLRALAVTLATVTLCAGICFLLLPGELAFPPPGELGRWAELFRLADWLNLDYNLVPSLHVTFGVVCVASFADRAGIIGKIFLWCWAGALGASTLLTGFILGMIGKRLIYCRIVLREPPVKPSTLHEV